MDSLPVDALLNEIGDLLSAGRNLVLEAPPGAGKTTRVPAALLGRVQGDILVLEPRRLAARLAARRVAAELGEPVGRTVGYQVRFEQLCGPQTRLRFLTEGVLTRRLLDDPQLKGVGCVILDEFHERHLEGDLALALLVRLQRTTRPDLRLAVMSATLKGDPVAAFIGQCPVLRSQGRLFPLEIEYTPHSAESLETRVQQAVERLLSDAAGGDILVFLPGAAEIRRIERALAPAAARASALLLPLYGDLSPDEQDRAVEPATRRKIILSTNVAESSITIDGVRVVVDSGLARVAADSVWNGLPRLSVARISRASAAQRAGRAGRTGPGRVVRLYSQDDLLRRPEADTPEILRRELAQLCLTLHAAALAHPSALDWLDAPPAAAVDAAEQLLTRLGALDARAAITPFGRRLNDLPLHPRLAALAVHGGAAGIDLAAELAAGGRPHAAQIAQQLRRSLPVRRALEPGEAALRAFPDRVARRRRERELSLSTGGSALLVSDRGMEKASFFVALDIEERPDQGLPLVRQAVPIEPELLLEVFPDRVQARDTVEWNREAARVETRSALVYDNLVIEESRGHSPDAAEAAALLATKAAEAGLERFFGLDDWAALTGRARFAGLDCPSAEAVLARLCQGLRSFAELDQAASGGGFLQAFLDLAAPDARARLDRLAPERIRLPSGRHAPVNYPDGAPPYVASRLQDFFGLRETPRIGAASVPLVARLLAPNQRPVQMTQDLDGFWRRLYPQLRKELSRRYPRHAWPEDPLVALPDPRAR